MPCFSIAKTLAPFSAAVAAAEAAFPAWSRTKPGFRRDLLLRAADELVKRKDDLFHFCSTETGSTEAYFEFDFNDALESLRSCAGLIVGVSSGSVPPMLDETRSAMLVREPYGVVVSIAPWNAPCILGLRSFLGPLASMYSVRQTSITWDEVANTSTVGNTVVVKGPERAPGAYWTLAGKSFRGIGQLYV